MLKPSRDPISDCPLGRNDKRQARVWCRRHRSARRPVPPAGYDPFLADLKSRIRSAQIRAALASNRELIQLYWDIGKGIVERQKNDGWGTAVVEQLAVDLNQEFPGIEGFSRSNLFRIRSFYRAWTEGITNVAQPVRQIENTNLQQPVGEMGAKHRAAGEGRRPSACSCVGRRTSSRLSTPSATSARRSVSPNGKPSSSAGCRSPCGQACPPSMKSRPPSLLSRATLGPRREETIRHEPTLFHSPAVWQSLAIVQQPAAQTDWVTTWPIVQWPIAQLAFHPDRTQRTPRRRSAKRARAGAVGQAFLPDRLRSSLVIRAARGMPVFSFNRTRSRGYDAAFVHREWRAVLRHRLSCLSTA